ncbi:FAST kinase domain-containing protein 5, mitochondrial [Augochlora pura]
MSIIVKRILNCRRDCMRILFNVKEYNQSNHVSCCSNELNTRTFVAFQQFPEDYKKCFMHQKYVTVSLNEETTEFQTSKDRSLLEHSQMHSLLQNSFYYSNTIVPTIKSTFFVTEEEIKKLIDMDWSTETPDNCINALKKITYYHLNGSTLELRTYDYIFKNLTSKLPALNDKQIQLLMQYLIVITSRIEDMTPYHSFTTALDKECLKRFFCSGVNQILYTLDALYQLRMYNAAYMWRGLRKLGSKLQKLNGKKMVQFLFYLSMCHTPDIHMYEVEYQLLENIKDLTADEIGIACRGFFLSKRKIQNRELIEAMFKLVINHVHNMHDIAMTSFMKQIRYSDNCFFKESVQEFFRKLQSKVVNIESSFTLTHIAHTMGATRVYDPIIMEHIIQRLQEDFSSARLKDIERIIYAVCTIVPHTDNHIYNKFLNLLLSSYKTTRAKEISHYPQTFIRCVAYFMHRKIFSEELIRYVLNPEFVKNSYNSNMKLLTNEYLFLHCTVQIELPHYTGPLLSKDIHNCLIKKFCCKSELRGRLPFVRFRTEVIHSCKELLGENVHIDYLLPHYYFPDVVLGFDEQNKLIPISSILSEMPEGSIKYVPKKHLQTMKWKVLVILNENSEIYNYNKYIGQIYTRLRQLQTIGYTPIPVTRTIWDTLNTDDKRFSYLKKLIYEQEPTDYLNE